MTNLNIAQGEYARAGQQVFALVDTRTWYVLANFQETYLDSIRPGMPADVYLMSYPNRRFRGTVQGIGWAVLSEDARTEGVLPDVKPSLNWVRLAQRIPVRIQLEPADPERPYRMGMTAVVTVRGDRDGAPLSVAVRWEWDAARVPPARAGAVAGALAGDAAHDARRASIAIALIMALARARGRVPAGHALRVHADRRRRVARQGAPAHARHARRRRDRPPRDRPGRRQALALPAAPGARHRRRHVLRAHHDGALRLHPRRRHLRHGAAALLPRTPGANIETALWRTGAHDARRRSSPAARSCCSGRTIPRSSCWTTVVGRARDTETLLARAPGLRAGRPPVGGRGRDRGPPASRRQLDLLKNAEARSRWLRQRHAEQIALITRVQLLVTAARRLVRLAVMAAAPRVGTAAHRARPPRAARSARAPSRRAVPSTRTGAVGAAAAA